MAIGTGDGIWKFGTQDEVTSGTPASVADDAYGKADQGTSVDWTNDDDATEAAAVLKVNFGSAPTIGNMLLIAHLMDFQGTNDTPVPSANYEYVVVGAFPIEISQAAEYYTVIPNFQIPMIKTAQRIDWWIKNHNTAQTIDASWQLWITPKSVGGHA